MQWGESRNLKLLRALLIGFPSLILISYFNRLDEIDRAYGGAGLPFGWGVAVLGLLLAITWLPPVPRPEALRLPGQGGSWRTWSRRLARAVMIFAAVLLVVGLSWEVLTNVAAQVLGVGTEDYWAARVLFAFLYGLASILFAVGPEEALIGDLHPWSVAETRALVRFLSSLAVGWIGLTVPFLVFAASQTGVQDLLSVIPFGVFFGTFIGLTIYAMSGLARPRPRPSHR